MSNSPEFVYLMRRELAAVYLLATYRAAKPTDIPTGTPSKWRRTLLTTTPTQAYLWTDADHSALNDFFRKHSQFESKMTWNNQVFRVIKMLRDAGLVDEGRALTLTRAGKRLYKELVTKCGSNPLKWPDTLCYNIASMQAEWEEAEFSPDAAYRF